MASEIIVNTIKAPTTGANANKVIIPSGVTLDASAGTLRPSAGAVVQVVHNFMTNNQTASGNSSSSTTFAEVNSQMRTTITPTSASNKLIIMAGLGVGGYNNTAHDVDVGLRLKEINNTHYFPETRYRVYDYGGSGTYTQTGAHCQYEHSPNTTSALTYTWEIRKVAGVAAMVNDECDTSYITILEIAQ